MIGQLLDGRYRIVQDLSSGGFGLTYVSEDTKRPGNPRCVVKQLRPPSQDPNTLRICRHLFKKEAETLERLGQHDQIPRLFAYFEDYQEFYLVQEFIPGYPVASELVAGQALPENQVINLLLEVLEILVFVHGQGVIHRDIKPANLMRRQTDGKIVLIDFGAVKEIATQVVNSQGQVTSTVAIGTPGYMPIEQFHSNPQFNSDIYALGVVAIQALTGLPANDLSRLRDPKNPSTGEIVWRHRAQVSPELARIIEKMVRFDCRQRYQSATQVLSDLRNLINQQNTQPRSTQLSQPQPRKKLWLTLAGIAGSIVVSILGLGFYGSRLIGDAEQLYKQGEEKYEQGDYKAAVDDFTRAIELYSNYAQAYNRRGDAFHNLEKYQEASEDYTQAIQLNPNDAEAYYDRGFAFYELGKYKEAVEDYNLSIELNSNDANAFYGRGLARSSTGDKQGAISDLTQAIELKSDFAFAYYQRGQIRRFIGQKQAAIEDFDQAIQIDPKYARAYRERGLTRNFIGDKQGAIADFTKAIELDPNYIDAYLGRGVVHSNLGDNQAAISDYNQVIKIDPNEPVAYNNRGLVRFDLGDKRGAIEDYNQAIKLSPDYPTTYNNRGNARSALGDKQGAIEDYTKAIELKSDFAQAYDGRGDARAALGDKQQAIEDYQQAAKLYLEQGLTGGYNDALFDIRRLQS